MNQPTNADRAARITATLAAYSTARDCQPDALDFRDMLADMMHYCDAEGLDFDHELSMATDNYADEVDVDLLHDRLAAN